MGFLLRIAGMLIIFISASNYSNALQVTVADLAETRMRKVLHG